MSASPDKQSSATGRTPRSGILTTPAGDRHIPQSTRPDGTLRREIKIRPGYRPPEDVEVYKNRTAEAWNTRGSDSVPGAIGLKDDENYIDPKIITGKNAKRRDARRRAKAVETIDETDATDELNKAQKPREISGDTKVHSQSQQLEETLDPEAEKEKRARNLRKKLRQARELKEKKDSGEGLLPEQFAKVIKIQELIRQLDSLGFDSDGARDPASSQ